MESKYTLGQITDNPNRFRYECEIWTETALYATVYGSTAQECECRAMLIVKNQLDETEFKVSCDELWDEFSETIGEDIGSLEYFAGRTVITLSQYFKLTAKIFNTLNQASK